MPFLEFPVELRRIVYTTNAIESLNARFRRAVRQRGHFPTEQAALKVLYLVATALTLCIVAPVKPQRAGDAANEALQRSPMRDLKEGVAYCWTMPSFMMAMREASVIASIWS